MDDCTIDAATAGMGPGRLSRLSRLSGRSLGALHPPALHAPPVPPPPVLPYLQLQPPARAATLPQSIAETARHATRRLRRALDAAGRSSLPKGERMRGLPGHLATTWTASAGYYRRHLGVLRHEVLCGMAATLLQIPETVAFSYVANLDPVVGLYATGFLGIIIGVLGGVPATVAGAAGAVAVVMPALTSSTGALGDRPYAERVEHLFVAVFVAGLLQLLFGSLELSRFFSMIPRTAHMGFLNGLALMMLASQRTTFQRCTHSDVRFGECEREGHLAWMTADDPTTWTTAFTVLLTIIVMLGFPKIPRIGRLLPPTLVVAVVGIAFEFGLNRPLLGYDVRTIGDTSPLTGSLPTPAWPRLGAVRDWPAVLSCAASLAMIGIFESIMTLQAIVDLTKQRLSRAAVRRECLAQGLGNVICGLFQAMGGCSMIGQSTGNILNGARHRVSSTVGGLMTFAVLLFASPVIERVPVACLTGILLVIIAHTFCWPSLRLVFYLRAPDAFALVLVTGLAAAVNLAVAVIAGVLWQSLVNGWTSGRQLHAQAMTEFVDVITEDEALDEPHEDQGPITARVYYLHGMLLYSSVMHFRTLLDAENDPAVVVVDLAGCHLADFSAVAALQEAALRYQDLGKTFVARGLDAHARDLVLDHSCGWELVGEILRLPPKHCSELGAVGHSQSAPRNSERPMSPTERFHAMVSPGLPSAKPYAVLPE